MSHNKLDIGCGDVDLAKAVFDAIDAVRSKCKAPGIKNGFLDTRHETEFEPLANFSHLTQKTEIKNQVLLVA